ncbi:MAG: hypothetical protein NT166_14885 [Candidatus Aminicenantes bacterium]|nr:hypothetical protein [Candidatus Aminicenantes bacterium]
MDENFVDNRRKQARHGRNGSVEGAGDSRPIPAALQPQNTRSNTNTLIVRVLREVKPILFFHRNILTDSAVLSRGYFNFFINHAGIFTGAAATFLFAAPLFVSLETPLYRKHNPLANTKKTLPIEHFKAALRTQAVNIEEKAPGIDQKAVDTEKKAFCSDQKVVRIEEKALRIDQQTVGIEEKAFRIDQQAVSIEEKALRIDQQAVSIEEKALRTDQQAVGIEEKALRIDQQAVGIEEKALFIDQKAIGIEKKALCTDQKAGGIYQEAGYNSLSAKLIFADKIKYKRRS